MARTNLLLLSSFVFFLGLGSTGCMHRAHARYGRHHHRAIVVSVSSRPPVWAPKHMPHAAEPTCAEALPPPPPAPPAPPPPPPPPPAPVIRAIPAPGGPPGTTIIVVVPSLPPPLSPAFAPAPAPAPDAEPDGWFDD